MSRNWSSYLIYLMHEYKGLDTTSTVTRASHASLAYSFIISIAKKEAKMGGQCHQFQGNFKALKLFTNPRVDMYISTTRLIKPPLQTFEAFLVVQKYLLALSSIGPSGLKLNHVNKMGPWYPVPGWYNPGMRAGLRSHTLSLYLWLFCVCYFLVNPL